MINGAAAGSGAAADGGGGPGGDGDGTASGRGAAGRRGAASRGAGADVAPEDGCAAEPNSALMSLSTFLSRRAVYRRFTAELNPMSSGWYRDAVLGGRHTMITPSACSSAWDDASSIIRYTVSEVIRRISKQKQTYTIAPLWARPSKSCPDESKAGDRPGGAGGSREAAQPYL